MTCRERQGIDVLNQRSCRISFDGTVRVKQYKPLQIGKILILFQVFRQFKKRGFRFAANYCHPVVGEVQLREECSSGTHEDDLCLRAQAKRHVAKGEIGIAAQVHAPYQICRRVVSPQETFHGVGIPLLRHKIHQLHLMTFIFEACGSDEFVYVGHGVNNPGTACRPFSGYFLPRFGRHHKCHSHVYKTPSQVLYYETDVIVSHRNRSLRLPPRHS